MALLRSIATVAGAATAVTVATSVILPSFRSKTFILSSNSTLHHDRFSLVKSFAHSPTAVHMESQAPVSDIKTFHQFDAALPELFTEYMVDMKCEGCVKAVKSKLEFIEGVKNVEVDLSNQVVRVLGSSPVKIMTEAIEQTGRKARLIGQGIPEEFLVSAAVSEFKGPNIFGVVRLAQVSMELARVEANFSGLSPGKHAWSINEYGDLTNGPKSTGKVFNPNLDAKEPLGDLGTLDVDEKGEVLFSGVKENLRVSDLIGRSIVVYATEDKSDTGLSAAVVARSAGVGENYKKLCTCDGTTIWEATNNDFATSKV
ncbi:copper chaperone for superoxide dismutase, chloroplastic/cytosolic [Impatiens glandulifera]|uniref:copper chaperone for superoxide dismutase, chloroplastic/cytosolic n=1 Tax=Impatiens glandulifera TaxID=253017 RepID=UPI001FB1171C|nr:copper chaperone for superoxide dismutase, chloroplastic/cytosolic [Impatiens glandulifera]